MKFEDITSILNREAANIRQLIQVPSFLNTIIDGLKKDPIDIDLSTDSWLNQISEKPGIYFFQADFSQWTHPWNNFITQFGNLWKHPTTQIGTSPIFYPRKAEKSIKQFNQNQKVPFYLE